MLSIEEKIKGCEFTDNFVISKDELSIRYNYGDMVHSCSILDFEKDITYPLFLQKIIDGMNRNIRILIEQRKRDILVGVNGEIRKTFYLIPVDIAKENVIKYVLEHL